MASSRWCTAAGGGAWCWDLLAAELARRGHTGPSPRTCPPATRARERPSTPRSVTAALAGETALAGERDVVLVAHSLAGLCAPLVAAAGAGAPVVYLAAMLPEPGRSVDERAREGDRQTRRGIGRGQTVNDGRVDAWIPQAAIEWLYPDSPPAAARAAAARLRPQHWRITAEPSPLTEWPDVPARYLLCRDDKVIDADWARAAAPRHAELVELPGDHSPFLARPAELADLLLA